MIRQFILMLFVFFFGETEELVCEVGGDTDFAVLFFILGDVFAEGAVEHFGVHGGKDDTGDDFAFGGAGKELDEVDDEFAGGVGDHGGVGVDGFEVFVGVEGDFLLFGRGFFRWLLGRWLVCGLVTHNLCQS